MTIGIAKNDDQCGWSNLLSPRRYTNEAVGSITADWLIVGAGYTGLAAAYAFAKQHPNQKIVIIDAQAAGEGASARNSGYLVDSTLNDGHLTDTGLSSYRDKYHLNKAGLNTVEQMVREHNIECDWNPVGKIHATSHSRNQPKLQNYSETLTSLELPHKILNQKELIARTGTSYYLGAVETEGAVMLQPAALARGMIARLQDNVSLYEFSPMISWDKISVSNRQNTITVNTPKSVISARNILFSVNGFMAANKIKQSRVFPLTLTASLTRPLTDSEYESIGSPVEWGILSAQAMGATVRLTSDRRIMIRNTAEVWPRIAMSEAELLLRKQVHVNGLQKRFPFLTEYDIDYTWSGVTCISKNNANIFQTLDNNVFAAGCYNGGGIGLAVLFGQEMPLFAAGESNDNIRMILNRPQPKLLPPQPLLNWGVSLKLAKDRYFSTAER